MARGDGLTMGLGNGRRGSRACFLWDFFFFFIMISFSLSLHGGVHMVVVVVMVSGDGGESLRPEVAF